MVEWGGGTMGGKASPPSYIVKKCPEVSISINFCKVNKITKFNTLNHLVPLNSQYNILTNQMRYNYLLYKV